MVFLIAKATPNGNEANHVNRSFSSVDDDGGFSHLPVFIIQVLNWICGILNTRLETIIIKKEKHTIYDTCLSTAVRISISTSSTQTIGLLFSYSTRTLCTELPAQLIRQRLTPDALAGQLPERGGNIGRTPDLLKRGTVGDPQGLRFPGVGRI